MSKDFLKGARDEYDVVVIGSGLAGLTSANILARAGYSSVTVERELNGVEQPDLELNGASFGFGAGIRSNNWDFRGEYSFMSGGDANSGVLGIFALRRF